MNQLSNTHLWLLLGLLLLLSAFFSSSETSMMSLNRYRLRHMARTQRRARRVLGLVERPDRLLGVILIGNNFANILASAITTVLTVRLFGDGSIVAASLVLTLIILIFAEITPKTYAALHPARIAMPVALPLKALLFLLYPLVRFCNLFSNGLLRMMGISLKRHQSDALSMDEFRALINEGGHRLPSKHRAMLLSVLNLEQACVEDIMVPRTDIIGLDISHDWSDVVKQLSSTQHTLLPVYHQDIDNISGMLHLRTALNLMAEQPLTPEVLKDNLQEPYFVPAKTPLNVQLLAFQAKRARVALVVNEYGDILGLVTLADLLEEIVGDFTTDMIPIDQEIQTQNDGSYLVDGSVLIRELNRHLLLKLSDKAARTVSGLIISRLETIPEAPLSVRFDKYVFEVIQIKDNKIRTAKLYKLPE